MATNNPITDRDLCIQTVFKHILFGMPLGNNFIVNNAKCGSWTMQWIIGGNIYKINYLNNIPQWQKGPQITSLGLVTNRNKGDEWTARELMQKSKTIMKWILDSYPS